MEITSKGPGLLDLPLEIREMIFIYVMDCTTAGGKQPKKFKNFNVSRGAPRGDGSNIRPQSNITAPFRINRQLGYEALLVFYEIHVFTFSTPALLISFLRLAKAQQANHKVWRLHLMIYPHIASMRTEWLAAFPIIFDLASRLKHLYVGLRAVFVLWGLPEARTAALRHWSRIAAAEYEQEQELAAGIKEVEKGLVRETKGLKLKEVQVLGLFGRRFEVELAIMT